MLDKFVVFEGMDGAGKDTAIQAAKKTLSSIGKNVLVLKPFNDRSKVYKEIIEPVIRGIGNTKYKYSDFILALMNEFKTTEKKIIDFITKSDNNIVILNRWYYSTLIYNARYKLEYDVIKYFTDDLLKPDMLYVLYAEPKVCMDRILKRSGELDLHENYLQLNEAYDEYINIDVRGITGTWIYKINTTDLSRDDLINKICYEFKRY